MAAGRGTRLSPLTDTLPKPLLPVRGVAAAELTLERLARAGCEAIALNLH
ncbi:MAG: nucleotidyltransferase family protein, partial [bacterium]